MIPSSKSRRFAALLCACFTVSAAPGSDYVVICRIAGPDGGWDYAKVDPATRRNYVARATNVMVIDPQHGDMVRANKRKDGRSMLARLDDVCAIDRS